MARICRLQDSTRAFGVFCAAIRELLLIFFLNAYQTYPKSREGQKAPKSVPVPPLLFKAKTKHSTTGPTAHYSNYRAVDCKAEIFLNEIEILNQDPSAEIFGINTGRKTLISQETHLTESNKI